MVCRNYPTSREKYTTLEPRYHRTASSSPTDYRARNRQSLFLGRGADLILTTRYTDTNDDDNENDPYAISSVCLAGGVAQHSED